jgi:hypothetical protein
MGEEMSLEQCIDECARGIQQKINDLQVALRNLAAITEQDIDDETDFKMSVELEDETVDLISGLIELLEELPEIAADIRGKCPKECKSWYADHKALRKDEKALRKDEKTRDKAKKKEQEKKAKELKAIKE